VIFKNFYKNYLIDSWNSKKNGYEYGYKNILVTRWGWDELKVVYSTRFGNEYEDEILL